MAKNNSSNQDYTNNADGWDLSGGTTRRKLTLTGADVTVTGSGTNVYTMPSATDTLVGRASTDTLTNKTLTSPVVNTPTGIVKGDVGLGNVDNTSNATERAATATLGGKTLTSPKLGSGGFIADANGNEVIKTPATVASAVNEITINNSPTLTPPSIEATGSDTNVSIDIKSKGGGSVLIDGVLALNATNSRTVTNKTIAGASNTISGISESMLSLARSTQVNAGTAGGNMYWINLGGIKILWGISTGLSLANSTNATYTWTLPTSFFTTIEMINPAIDIPGTATNPAVRITLSAKSASSVTTMLRNDTGATQSITHTILIFGA